MPDHEFKPKRNLTYQFLLQKLQHLDEKYGNPEDEAAESAT